MFVEQKLCFKKILIYPKYVNVVIMKYVLYNFLKRRNNKTHKPLLCQCQNVNSQPAVKSTKRFRVWWWFLCVCLLEILENKSN